MCHYFSTNLDLAVTACYFLINQTRRAAIASHLFLVGKPQGCSHELEEYNLLTESHEAPPNRPSSFEFVLTHFIMWHVGRCPHNETCNKSILFDVDWVLSAKTFWSRQLGAGKMTRAIGSRPTRIFIVQATIKTCNETVCLQFYWQLCKTEGVPVYMGEDQLLPRARTGSGTETQKMQE